MSNWLRDYQVIEEKKDDKADEVVSKILDRKIDRDYFTTTFMLYREIKKEVVKWLRYAGILA